MRTPSDHPAESHQRVPVRRRVPTRDGGARAAGQVAYEAGRHDGVGVGTALLIQRAAGNASATRYVNAQRRRADDLQAADRKHRSPGAAGGAQCEEITDHHGSNLDKGGLVVQRSVTRSGNSPEIQGRQEYQKLLHQYRELLEQGQIGAEDQHDADAEIQRVEAALRQVQDAHSAGSTAAGLAAGGLVVAGGLLADDATVVGVADDVVIPFALLFAGAAALTAWAQSSSAQDKARAVQAARQALGEAMQTIGGIVLAARVGDQIRSNTQQLAIHLARLLGTTVSGMPPDHQQDPERDRPHWWKEIKNFVKQIRDKGLTPKQLWRELSKRFTKEQLQEILKALEEAAKKMGQDPPDFPPIAFP